MNGRTFLFTLSLISFLFISVFTFSAMASAPKQVSTNSEAWKVVPHKEVCMVTNAHFGRPQIPVEQAGKTYYGCCENCKETIKVDSAARTAKDPVTGKSVDKAKAVIAANSKGAVLYFENRANFEKYASGQAQR